jgi:tetratricopeptide (TPR) repeat protein
MAEITLQDYIQEIDEFIEQGRHEDALAHGRHILQHYPKFLLVYRLLGKAVLEVGQDDLAVDMFQRALSGDPGDFVAHVGMSIVCERRGDLAQAVWHMERALELTPNNEAVQDELRRLYGRRDGAATGRLQLTRGGLARLYMQGNLLPRAIDEFRALLADEPGRMDLQVALAEALWRNEQRVQAEEVCLQVLDKLPYCLQVNLLLGEIWTRSGRKEGHVHLQRAEALDPENRAAVKFLGDASPLQLREIRLPRLENISPTPGGGPAWLTAVGASPEERALTDAAVMGGRVEIPAWLEGVEEGEGEGERVAEAPADEEDVAVPDWLLDQAAEGQEGRAPPGDVEVPEWLRGIGEEGTLPGAAEAPEPPVSGEVPDWLKDIAPSGVTEGVEAAAEAPPESLASADIPDWLKDMAPPGALEEDGAGPAPAEAPGAGEAYPPAGPSAEAEVPEWLADVAQPTAGEEAPAPVAPGWLEEEGLPSGDDALAFLESLAAGKEDELRATARAEGEARMAEIMGRQEQVAPAPPVEPAPAAEAEQPPAPAEVPEWLAEFTPPAEVTPPEPQRAEPPPPEAGAFGWTAFGVGAAESAPPVSEERAPPADEIPAAEAPVGEETVVSEAAPAAPPPVEKAPAEAEAAPAAKPLPEGLEELQEHVRSHPRDYEAWLTLARGFWAAALYAESLEAYSRALRSKKWVKDVVLDMEGHVEERPLDQVVRRVLGDAYMRDGRLSEALEVYREALENL